MADSFIIENIMMMMMMEKKGFDNDTQQKCLNKYPVDEMRVERNPSLKQTGMDDDDSAVATCKHLSSENRDCAEDQSARCRPQANSLYS